MKKKLFFVVAVALCVAIAVFSFAGCSRPTGVEQFNTFKKKIITVLKDNGINIADVEDNQAVEPVNTVVSLAKYDSTNHVDKMKEIILEDSAIRSDAQRVDDARVEMYDQALTMTLVVGDGMVNNHNADTIYDTSVLVDCWGKSYMEFKTSGTLTTINHYSPASDDDCNYAGVVYLDYKSESDYNFVMLVIWEDGRMGYRYGNEKKQFVYLDYDPQGKYSEIYFSSKVGEGYISYDAKVVNKCYELVKGQFAGIKVNDYEYLTEQKYTIDETEWLSLCAKYFPSDAE